jgi:hypothetical protein
VEQLVSFKLSLLCPGGGSRKKPRTKAFQFVRFHGGRDGMIPFPSIVFDFVWFFEGIPVR